MDYSPFFKNPSSQQQPLSRQYTRSPSVWGIPVHQEDPAQPIQRPPVKVVQIPVHFVGSESIRSASALKIQKVFRGFLVRKSVKKILAVKIQVDGIGERLLRNEVVELINRDDKERLRMNESLMALLFKLDSIRGVDSGVRDFRKAVIRKAIALQERIDAIAAVLRENRDETREFGDSFETINSDTLAGEMEDSECHNSAKLKNSTETSDDHSDKLENSEENLDSQTFESEDKVVMEVIDVGVANEENFLEICDTVEERLIENEEKEKLEGKENGGQTDQELLAKMMEENLDNKTGQDMLDRTFESEDRVAMEDTDVGVDHEAKTNEENFVDKCDTVLIENEENEKLEGKGNGGQTDRELLEKMMEENGKMISLMMQLYERNETQTCMLNALTHRVEQLERAFICDMLRRKKKKHSAGN